MEYVRCQITLFGLLYELPVVVVSFPFPVSSVMFGFRPFIHGQRKFLISGLHSVHTLSDSACQPKRVSIFPRT